TSLPLKEFISESYMGMIRNIQRYGWLIPYLFGASPAISQSFVGTKITDLQVFDTDTLYYPYATSLRMGDIGYQNSLEEGKGFRANYDNLDAYLRSLSWATTTVCPEYQKLGVIRNGQYQQLNTNILQIENEHYSTIRPKQNLAWLEKPISALRQRGIQYVELRSLDVNIFEPTGVNSQQLYFVEMLLLLCLFQTSPRISALESKEINTNQILVAHSGRKPNICLWRNGCKVAFNQWANELITEMQPIADILDNINTNDQYTKALTAAAQLISDPDTTPSAKILNLMRNNQASFV
ncbi:glutamate--cysteine ligase, partial [Achromatium sp. WMS2]